MKVNLYDNDSGRLLGQVTEGDVQFLIDHLQEEHAADQDYWLNATAIDGLEDLGGDPDLIGILRAALADREGFEIRWSAT